MLRYNLFSQWWNLHLLSHHFFCMMAFLEVSKLYLYTCTFLRFMIEFLQPFLLQQLQLIQYQIFLRAPENDDPDHLILFSLVDSLILTIQLCFT